MSEKCRVMNSFQKVETREWTGYETVRGINVKEDINVFVLNNCKDAVAIN